MTYRYVLNGKEAVPCPDFHTWATLSEDQLTQRRVDLTEIGEYRISTVFLGVDHNFSQQGDPLLFETMIFGGIFGLTNEEYQTRCSTWKQAEAMHTAAIKYTRELCLCEHPDPSGRSDGQSHPTCQPKLSTRPAEEREGVQEE